MFLERSTGRLYLLSTGMEGRKEEPEATKFLNRSPLIAHVPGKLPRGCRRNLPRRWKLWPISINWPKLTRTLITTHATLIFDKFNVGVTGLPELSTWCWVVLMGTSSPEKLKTSKGPELLLVTLH